MCLLLRLGKLKEVWMGTDGTREIYRSLVYELLNWRDAQRELKVLIKARYRGWGVLRLHGIRVFSAKGRQEYLAQLPAEEAFQEWARSRGMCLAPSSRSRLVLRASSSSGSTLSWGLLIEAATTNRRAISGWTGGATRN